MLLEKHLLGVIRILRRILSAKFVLHLLDHILLLYVIFVALLGLVDVHFAITHDLDIIVLRRLGQVRLFCRVNATEVKVRDVRLLMDHGLINSVRAI